MYITKPNLSISVVKMMRMWWIVISLGVMSLGEKDDPPEARLNMPYIMNYYGYPSEIHDVKTEDGYILNLHRIPNEESKKPPVLLQHGNICSSAVWVINGPGKALAYLLSDAGYDVWLGNFRGTTYSQGHIVYDSKGKDKQYWNFTIDDIVFKDTPATIDHILKTTGAPKLLYVGHSIGGTMILGLGSAQPEYNDKVIAAIALAPTWYLFNLKSPLVLLAPIAPALEVLADIDTTGLLTRDTTLGPVAFEPCTLTGLSTFVCAVAQFLTCGFSGGHFNYSLIPAVTSNIPAGTSLRVIVQLLQGHNLGLLHRYSNGVVKNIAAYGQAVPPKYHLDNFKIPVALVGGTNDYFGDPLDMKSLDDTIEAPKLRDLQIIDGYMHLDYLFAKDSLELVNIPIVETFNRLSGGET